MRIMNLRVYDKPGNLKAFLDIETSEGFVMKGFKIMDGKNGLWLSPPSEKAPDGKYYPRVWVPKEISDSVLDLALTAYKEAGGNSSPSSSSIEAGGFPF